jgi:uncharacterized membrane protein HdeD (DUF308 family)
MVMSSLQTASLTVPPTRRVAFVAAQRVDPVGTTIFGDRGTTGRRGWLVVEGIAGILAGTLIFVWPGVATLVLLWLIAAWALVTGVLEIVVAVRPRREIEGELAICPRRSLLRAVRDPARGMAGALTVAFLIGVYAIVFGVVLIGLGLRLHRLRQNGAFTGTHRPATA